MRYNFKNSSGRTIEREFKMLEVPELVVVNGEIYNRDFVSENKSKGTIIPEHMKSGQAHRFFNNNTKGPSGRKHHF